MRHIIRNEFFLPILKRGGAFVGSYLIVLGVPHDAAQAIVLGLVAAGGVILDLVVTKFTKGKTNGTVQ